MKESRSAVIRILISMILFGTLSIAVRGAGLPSAVLALFRAVTGGLSVMACSLLKGNRIEISAIRRNFPRLLLSGVCLGFNWVLLFEAYRYTSVTTATLCYYMQPIILVLVSPVFLKEKLTVKKVLCVFAAMYGMVLVSGILEGSTGGYSMHGIALALSAAVLYAAVILCNKRMGPMLSFDRVASQLLLSVPALLVYVMINDQFRGITLTAQSVFWILVTGIVYTGITYMLFYGSIPYVSGQTVAVLSYVDPVTAMLVSAVFFREPVTLRMAAGAALILGAALVSELKKK